MSSPISFVDAALSIPRPRSGELDLRSNPDWRPDRAELHAGRWEITLWSEPLLPGKYNYDDFLVSNLGDRLRLGVFDAVVNVLSKTPHETAILGTSLTRAYLKNSSLSPDEALHAASEALCNLDLRPRHRNPLLTAAVADLDPFKPEAFVSVSADAEVWVKTETGWSSPFAADMLTPAARAAYQAATSGLKDVKACFEVQEELLDDPSTWTYPPLGLVPTPLLRSGQMEGVTEVIVATDGAKLNAQRCEDLTSWLEEGLQQRPSGSPHPSPHGDVIVLHAVFA